MFEIVENGSEGGTRGAIAHPASTLKEALRVITKEQKVSFVAFSSEKLDINLFEVWKYILFGVPFICLTFCILYF